MEEKARAIEYQEEEVRHAHRLRNDIKRVSNAKEGCNEEDQEEKIDSDNEKNYEQELAHSIDTFQTLIECAKQHADQCQI